MNRGIIAIVTLLALGIIGGAGYWGYASVQEPEETAVVAPVTVPVTKGEVRRTVTAPGQVVGIKEQMLSFTVSGQLAELLVQPGTVVQAGETIAQLDPTPFENNLSRAELRWQQAQADYEQQLANAALNAENSEALVNSTRGQVPSLTAAQVQLDAAIAAEARAQEEYQKALDRHWEPDDVKEAYRLELEAITNQRIIAQANLDAIVQQQWAISQQAEALETETERAALQQQFLAAQGVDPLLTLDVQEAEAALAATTLVAPFDGVVLAVLVTPGEAVGVGQPLLLLADPTAVEIRTTVIEEDVPLTAVNQPAELFFDAQPEFGVAGRVARIVPQRVVGEERPLYHVYLTLDEPLPEGVLPGMTADASIIIDEAADVLRLPRALVIPRADGTAGLTVWANGQEQEANVTVGLRGDAYVVVEGVGEGTAVVAE